VQNLSEAGFKARSADRDAETDRSRRGSIFAAIENALRAAEHEQSGLSGRVEDVLARASVTLGNGTGEYLERESLDSYHQDLFSVEISNGQRRLTELAADISQFKLLSWTDSRISSRPRRRGSFSHACFPVKQIQSRGRPVYISPHANIRSFVDYRLGHKIAACQPAACLA
jgi:hypothetical protein